MCIASLFIQNFCPHYVPPAATPAHAPSQVPAPVLPALQPHTSAHTTSRRRTCTCSGASGQYDAFSLARRGRQPPRPGSACHEHGVQRRECAQFETGQAYAYECLCSKLCAQRRGRQPPRPGSTCRKQRGSAAGVRTLQNRRSTSVPLLEAVCAEAREAAAMARQDLS